MTPSHAILLADDHQIIRQGLRSLLDKEDDMRVVAEADNGRSAVQLAHQHEPDVVVMDIGMPGLNGVEATRQIVRDKVKTKIIALSMHCRSQFVGSMLEAGASGYLLKDCAAQELIEAIREVLAGRVYLSKAITGVVVEHYVRHRPVSPNRGAPSTLLTAREREILQLLAEGLATKQIAGDLHVSIKTIESHRQKIMEKLDIHSIAGLTKYAIREGITPFDV